MKFRILIQITLVFLQAFWAFDCFGSCQAKLNKDQQTICDFENIDAKHDTYFLVLPKQAKAKTITINGNSLLKDKITFYRNLSGYALISKFAFPVPSIYFTSEGLQHLKIEWERVPPNQDLIELKPNVRSGFSHFYFFIPTFFALVFVVVIFFIKNDFEVEDHSFDFALWTGIVLAVHLYLNSSHAYLEYSDYSNAILKFHVFIISLTTVSLIGLTDNFFGVFKNKLYLLTPLITLFLLLLAPGFKGDEHYVKIMSAIIPNALVTTIGSFLILYRFLFDKKFKDDITYIPIILTGFVTLVITLVDTYVASFDAFTEPPISGYGLFLCYITIVMCFIIKNKKVRINNLVVHEQVASIAKQVAHDIRSPLAALKIQLASIHDISSDKQVFLKDCISRINDILTDLSDHNMSAEEQGPHEVLVSKAVEQVIAEKKLEHHKIQILNITPLNQVDLVAAINQSDFKRMLSNLINNSIEALKDDLGIINVLISPTEDTFIKIMIEDNGFGIPLSIMSKITNKSFTHNKKSGQGLGLSYVKEQVDKLNGEIKIESVENIFTKISFTIPQSFKKRDYVLIDDEELMRLGWTIRSLEQSINFKSYSSHEEFLLEYKKDSMQFCPETVFYIDYELQGNIKGTEVASEIFKLGYTHIYICSGRESIDLKSFPFIKGCVPKDFTLF